MEEDREAVTQPRTVSEILSPALNAEWESTANRLGSRIDALNEMGDRRAQLLGRSAPVPPLELELARAELVVLAWALVRTVRR